jgi:HD-like signal output (HDOD) protein
VAEQLRSLKPVISPIEMSHKLKAAFELKALSPTVARVLDLTRSAGVSVDSVVNAIKCDQAIALRIIKLANSAVYLRGDRVNTVKAAVLRIGLQQIQQAVQNIGVIERFNNIAMETYLNHVLFWEHSLGTGIIAAQLATATKATDSDTAFTMGLLHDVGRVLLAEAMPEQYLKVLITSREGGLPLEQVEKRMLTTTHAEIMQEVLRGWNFPRQFADPISCHQSSAGTLREACPGQLQEAALLVLANRLAHAMFLGCSGTTHVADVTDLCELLRIEGSTVARILETAETQTTELKLAMLSSASNVDLSSRVTLLREEFGGPFRPLFVNGGQKPDAYQIMCQRLADAGASPPTVAVVHLRSAKDKPAAAAAVAAGEKAVRCAPLPMIVISPTGQINLEEPYSSRPAVLLPEPVSTPRFASAVRNLQERAVAKAA